ncbi:MAG: aminoacyl-tRNA hydrolase [Planctomycetaceae bacterium]|jgi:ribosome-associated protein|nr:aminoacyl-tRNA hydrolase [Planctomycetaceae bacterium]
MLIVTDEIRIPLEELQFTFVRSSGPGGQNVNKVASKAVLRWNPAASGCFSQQEIDRLFLLFPSYMTKAGEMVITSQRTRDALKNKLDCQEKLRTILQVILKKAVPRIPTRPTKGSVQRRLRQKSRQSQKKQCRKKPESGDW